MDVHVCTLSKEILLYMYIHVHVHVHTSTLARSLLNCKLAVCRCDVQDVNRFLLICWSKYPTKYNTKHWNDSFYNDGISRLITSGWTHFHQHSSVIYSTCISIHRRTSIGHECRRKEDISHNGGHLTLEGLTARLPSLFLIIQTLQQGNTSLHL